jgi:Ni/Co efflux regulator RcnB/surface antigen
MKNILTAALAMSLLSGTAVMAQPNGPYPNDQYRNDQGPNGQYRNDQGPNGQYQNGQGPNGQYRNDQGPYGQYRNDQGYNRDRRDDPNARFGNPRWSRGDRVPNQYRDNRYFINDWQQRNLRRPPRGQRWVSYDNNNYFLMMMRTGVITDVFYRDDRDQRWRQRYAQNYTYNDDSYYRNCRSSADPAGIIAGALIGGLLGNAVGQGNGGATVAGVILGGATGAALTQNLNCEDQSYAYRTYYDGFNSGRPNSSYQWRNPRNGNYGNFRVIGYANDPNGFRCANYNQEIFINGRPQITSGRACQQPDGTWVIVG